MARHGGGWTSVVTGAGSGSAQGVRGPYRPPRQGGRRDLNPRADRAPAELPGSAILHAHGNHALTLPGVAAGLIGAQLVMTRRVDFALRRRFLAARQPRHRHLRRGRLR
jgi:hypothetical protein